MSPLVELPVEAHQILATWQSIVGNNGLEGADAPTTQAVKDTVTLLEILTKAKDLGPELLATTNQNTALNDQNTAINDELANAIRQIQALTDELSTTEAAMNML